MPDTANFQLNKIAVNIPIRTLLTDNFDHSYSCYYQKNTLSELSALCDKYGSDKGEIATSGHPYPWPSHTYADFVERHFEHCREYVKNVFECGMGTNNAAIPANMGVMGQPGASLRVWRDYFPNANIYGADIDKNILFQDERIATFYCDQTNPAAIANMWSEIKAPEFDLMIDDGLHTYDAGRCMFENSFHKLKKGGMYIIEDVAIASLLQFKEFFSFGQYKYDFVNLYRKNVPLLDNSLVVIRK